LRRVAGLLAPLGALLAGCGVVSSLGSAPALFPKNFVAEHFDFEDVDPSGLPNGFERLSGSWAVADSPNAASGQQLVSQKSDKAGMMTVQGGGASPEVRGEVAVRVVLGPAGAGIGCGDGARESFAAILEPEKRRIALYRRDGGKGDLLGEAPADAIVKGKWARVGILCRSGLVAAYLGGKPVVSKSTDVADGRVLLVAEEGVTAQFDDLSVSAVR
jgi:hypothetical protein